MRPRRAVGRAWRWRATATPRDEVDIAYAAALAAGATAIMEPIDRDWGGRSGYFADPEGNRWEIAWAPGMQFDERGSVTSFGG